MTSSSLARRVPWRPATALLSSSSSSGEKKQKTREGRVITLPNFDECWSAGAALVRFIARFFPRDAPGDTRLFAGSSPSGDRFIRYASPWSRLRRRGRMPLLCACVFGAFALRTVRVLTCSVPTDLPLQIFRLILRAQSDSRERKDLATYGDGVPGEDA